jgi:amino acid adenylation domain-containing protein
LASHAPLSFPQERLWFLHHLKPGDTAYNEPYAWRLIGPLDVQALRRAFEALVARHDVLRTVFEVTDGQPGQVVLPEVQIPFELREVSAQTDLEALVQTEVASPFDLSRGPLLRVRLFKFSSTEHLLLVIWHHIVIDSWSLGSIWRELGALYSDFVGGGSADLPRPVIQYSDFSRWQRQTMQGPMLEEQLAYWRRELSTEIPVLELAGDRPQSASASTKGARHRSVLSASLTRALRDLARKEGATLYIALQAGVQMLFHRYSGLDSFTMGTLIANRARPEFESMVGFCANALVLRADFEGNPTAIEVLRRVRDRAFDAYEHQDVPFELVVSDLRPDRHGLRNPLFEVVLVFENTPPHVLQLTGLSACREPVSAGTAKFDLTLILEEDQGGLSGIWEYRTDLFDAGTIQRMAGHFQRILTEITADPGQSAATIPLLPEEERHQLLVEWNDTRRDFPREETIHGLFEAQAARTPDAVALIGEERVLTYRELNERSNQVAHYLRSNGVTAGDRVAVVLDRSIEYVIAVLGTLKAGAAYVPIDPETPALRLQTMLDDAGVRLVLESRDGRMPNTSEYSCANPLVPVSATDPCYVIYTSGSTGVPKGVEVRHRGVIRLVFGNDFLPFDDKQTFLLSAPVQFDASTMELWGPLLHGSTLAVDSEREFDLHRLRALIERHHVTCLWLTSALFNVVIDHQPELLENVPHVMIGGEALSVAHVRRALDLLPRTELINGYGPTEATVFATTFRIPRTLSADAANVPIGKPVGNTQIYILDRRQQLVPIGVPGEICIGGDGVAMGYVGDAALTAARFIANPFEPGTTIYRTGDVGRYLPDGNIEFLGRTDHQVKVRGFRVELGEVEHHLKQHPDVHDAVVVVAETAHRDRALAAYVTMMAGTTTTASEVQRFIAQRLPGYCVPSTLTVVESFPLTATGKIDRKALSLMVQPPQHQMRMAMGRTPTEERLAAIWQEVLGVPAVGVTDNFFDLGGDSLIATRVQMRVESQLGTRVRLSYLFAHPTIAELAIAIDAQKGSGSSPDNDAQGA